MTALLQISDPHFGTEIPRVVDALRELVKRLRPSLVVLSGDVTQRATPDEFGRAQAFLSSLDLPAMLAIPGNHDIPLLNLALRIARPFARYRRALGKDLEPLFDDADLRVVGVNSVMPRWHKDGKVGRRRIERAAARLRSAGTSQLRIIVCHHPVATIRAEDTGNRLHGAEEAVPAWVDAGVDLILGGHIHLPYVRPLGEHFPGLSRNAWVLQAGTAVSSRLRAGVPNSVNLVEKIEDDRGLACRIERWDYRKSVDAFEPVLSERLALDRRTIPA